MSDQSLTELSLPDAGPALAPLPSDDDARIKTDLIDEIFGVPEPERSALEEPSGGENLQSAALNLEDALSEVFDGVEGAAEATPAGGDVTDRGEGGAGTEEGSGDSAEGDESPSIPAGSGAGGDGVSGGGGDPVSNGQPPELPGQPSTEGSKQDTAPAATAPATIKTEDDDDIVVLNEISPAPTPPAGRQKVATPPAGGLRRLLRGPASKRSDFASLGPPSSRMPPSSDSDSSDSDIEVEQALAAKNIKMMGEARRLRVAVSLRLNNVCLETSQTARQWAVTIQQRREARKRHWEEVRRGPRPPPTPRRTSRSRGRTRPAAKSPQAARQAAAAASLAQQAGKDFPATNKLMNLINRGVLQMNSVLTPPPVNGRPRAAAQQRGRVAAVASGRGRAMVQIPAASLQRQHLTPTGPGRGGSPYTRGGVAARRPAAGPAAAANLAAIPDLGEKQRSQLLKLLTGNNGTSISPAPVELRPQAPPVKRQAVLPPDLRPASRPSAPKPPPPKQQPIRPKQQPPPPKPPPPPEPDKPRLVPEYCHTTTGSPEDLFSVYLTARQQPEKCFVNMQVDNMCLKVRLPARPKTTGMVFAMVTRRSMEPDCQITVDSSEFHPPGLAADAPPDTVKVAPRARPPPPPQQPPPPAPAPAPLLPRSRPVPEPVARPSHSCGKCPQRFPTVAMLEYHYKVNHATPASEQADIILQCPLCSHWRSDATRMRQHISVVHAPDANTNYKCAVCSRAWGYGLSNMHGVWLRHVMSHANPVSRFPKVALQSRTARQARQTAGQTRAARAGKTTPGMFKCPECNLVFPDVSKFPEHWRRMHTTPSGGGGGGQKPSPAAVAATRAVRPQVSQRVSSRQLRGIPSQSFSSRFVSSPAPAAAAANSGDARLRCTRCGELFSSEPAYAQHWIHAHTSVKLAAEEQAAAAAASGAAPAPAPAPGAAGDAPPPPEVVATEAAKSDDTVEAMEEGDSPPDDQPSSDQPAPVATDESSPMDVSADAATASTPDDAAGTAATTENGVSDKSAPADPAEEAASMVPSDADFAMSEETLDKMLEQIVPMKKKRK